MPTAVQLAGASFVNPLYKPLPSVPGLVAWSYWGGSLAASQNVISAGGAYTNYLTGPVWSPAYGHCVSGVGQIQSAFNGTAPAQTCLVAARWVSGGTGGAAASIESGAALVPSLVGGGASVQLTATGIAQPTPVVLNTTATAFKFYAFQAGNGNAAFIYDLTANLSATGGTAGNITPGAANILLGGATPGANNQQCDIAFLAHYNSFVSKPNIDLIYAHVKDVLAGRGIVV
jgi:hypothetical protein